MKKRSLGAVFVLFMMIIRVRSIGAQTPSAENIIKLDPTLDELIAPDAKLEMVKENAFTSAEGPTWVQQGKTGYLLFSDVDTNTIQKFEPGCDKFPCPIDSGKISV